MRWAVTNRHVVFTHDLDFSALLALTGARGPSVVQVRTQAILPDSSGEVLLRVIAQYAGELERGAIVTVDLRRARVRLLPIPGRQGKMGI